MAKTKRRIKPKKQQKQTISPIVIGIVTAVVIVVVGGFILLSNGAPGTVAPPDISQFPTLGEPNAPVTIVEYSDYG